jgi:hypothetical protein
MSENRDKTRHESADSLNEREKMDRALGKLDWAVQLLGKEQPELAAMLAGDKSILKNSSTSHKEDGC